MRRAGGSAPRRHERHAARAASYVGGAIAISFFSDRPIDERSLSSTDDQLNRIAAAACPPVTHRPFQGEIDERVDCIEDRETSTSVFDAQKTMEICLAAGRSAESGGQPIALPLIED